MEERTRNNSNNTNSKNNENRIQAQTEELLWNESVVIQDVRNMLRVLALGNGMETITIEHTCEQIKAHQNRANK